MQLWHSGSWSWDGEVIVHKPVVPNARKQPITGRPYDVDVRAFLETTDNAILREALDSIAKEDLGEPHRSRFLARTPGSFDFRVEVLKRFVAEKVKYEPRPDRFDAWLYPEETLSSRRGDCEDRAFLLASLMIASGISSYCVRVVLGKVHALPRGKTIDHVWVMYKDESGLWQCIEPLDHARGGKRSRAPETRFVYEPMYLFNDEHMWAIGANSHARTFTRFLRRRKDDSTDTRRTLRTYRPSFGYPRHRDTVWKAIDPDQFNDKLTDAMRSQLDWHPVPPTAQQCLDAFASMVADVDITFAYNPLLHFDNGLIEESQALLIANLKSGTLEGFARACHATADFYAHTSFPYFAKRSGSDIVVATCFDPADGAYSRQFQTLPDYSRGNFALERFSTNARVWKKPDKRGAAKTFEGRIISGRFGQWRDSQGALEHTQFYTPSHDWQGALPHHNEIAVDSESRDPDHVLCSDQDYPGEFERRSRAAVAATRTLFAAWR